MFKKTLISVAVASTLGLTGCLSDGGSGSNADPDFQISNPEIDGKTWPIFNPITGALPLPNDLIFDSVAGDGSFRVADTSPPVTTALNGLSGASTVAPAVIRLNGQIDPDSVDAQAVIMTPSGPLPNPNQNVFLIELAYASGDPVQGLSGQEAPTIPLALTAQVALGAATGPDLSGRNQMQAGAYLAGLISSPEYTAEVVTLDGTSAIRINPEKPLNPRKRYIAVVTKEVLDINGDPIIQSPTYTDITTIGAPLGNSALGPVRNIVNGLWETIAGNYFGLNNLGRATPLTVDDIAISYSFTTSNDEKVLQYIAEPAAWFSDQLTTFVKVSAAKAAKTGGATDFAGTLAVVNGAIAAFPSAEIKAALGPVFANPPPAGCDTLTGQIAIDCVGFALANTPAVRGGFADLLPTPKARSVTLDLAGTNDVALTSAVVSQVAPAGSVNLVQGTIALPYYLGTPSGTNGSPIKNVSWKADSGLAAVLNNSFSPLGLNIPQANPATSTVANYIFPFPQENSVTTVPMLVMYPSDGDVSGGTVIYQHGITTDRSATLTFGSALAATANVAVVAIDQPLHGIAPFSTASQDVLAGRLLTAGGQTNDAATRQAVVAGQLSLGALQQIDSACGAIMVDFSDPASIAAGKADVLSGVCGAGAATTLGGAISIENTVATAGSTIPGIAPTANERHFGFFGNAASQPVQMNFDPASAAGVGLSGSLFINLTNFLNGRDNLRQGSVDMMNLRASLGAIDFNGPAAGGTLDTTNVYFVGHSLGTINGSPFVAASNQNQIELAGPSSGKTSDDVVAANLLTPGGGIIRLLENSPSFAPTILGGLSAAAGLEQGDANLELYFNVFQAALDTVDPINFSDNHLAAGTGILLSEVLGDQTIPNSVNEGETLGNAFLAPLAGTEPLATTLGATATTTAGTSLPAITRYTAGTHSTPVSVDNLDVFLEMVGQANAMIMDNGLSTMVIDDTNVQ